MILFFIINASLVKVQLRAMITTRTIGIKMKCRPQETGLRVFCLTLLSCPNGKD
ncbi:hypothetical protein DR72_863 [Klebsiella aerogenes]|nr:hypothetical protein DR72_863 [Klebsiella aerogenes]